jgi:hypothetical protein
VIGPVSASFAPTAEIKSVTRVRVFQENWSEDRIAIETPAGFFVAEGDVIDSKSYNDPGCFGSTTVTVQGVRATAASVEVMLGQKWKNRRYLYEPDGGVQGVSDSDDIRKVTVACTIAGSKMTCKATTTEKVCHIDKQVVPCDSF